MAHQAGEHKSSAKAREQVEGVPRLLVLVKARTILDAFTPQEPELSIPELTARTGLPASTCFRLVRNLTYDGLLERVNDRYRIGLTIVRWARAALENRNIVNEATPILDWLRDQTGESAMLCVLESSVAVLVALAGSRHSVVRQLHVGDVHALHAGSTGKIFLAFDPEAEKTISGQRLEAFTENTIIDPDQLRAELETIRSNGYASSFEERHLGAAGITAPVFDERGQLVGSVGLTGPVARMGHNYVRRYAPLVQEAARRISGRLGYRTTRS